MKNLPYIIIAAFLLLVACAKNKDYANAQMDIAEGLVANSPNKAIEILSVINKGQLAERELARYSLLYTIAQDKSGLDVSSDSLLRYAHSYYSENMDDSMYARYAYYMGKYYYLIDSLSLSHSLLHKSVKVAKDSKEYYTACLALGLLSRSLENTNTAKAIEYAKENIEILQNHLPEKSIVYPLLSLANSFVFAEEYDSALSYTERAYKVAQQENDSAKVLSACHTLAAYYDSFCMPDSALKYGVKMAEYSHELTEAQYLLLGSIYYECDSSKKAESLLKKVTGKSDSQRKYTAFSILSRIALERDDIALHYSYMDSAYHAIEGKYSKALETNAQYYADFLDKEIQNEKIRSKAFLSRWIMGAGIIILTLIIVLSYCVYHNYRAKTSKLRIVEKLRNRMQMEFKEREHEKMMEQKDRFISILQRHLLEKSQIMNALGEGKSSNINTISESDWMEMETLLNDVDNFFAERIRKSFPGIKTDDFRFCMLVRMKLTNQELAGLFNVEQDSIKKRKQRMKRNVFAITDPSVTLSSFIESF